MATAALGMLRIQAVLRARMVRKHIASLQASNEVDDEAAQLQDTMAAWRQRTGKAIASMVLSSTVTMALTKVRIKRQRRQARSRIEATIQMVHEVLQAGVEKDRFTSSCR